MSENNTVQYFLGRQPRVVVLGHSFTRRVDSRIWDEFVNLGLQPAIDAGMVSVGQLTAHALRVDHNFAKVDFRHCAYADSYDDNTDFADELLAVAALAPDLLLVCLGSNDLIRPHVDPGYVAYRLFTSMSLLVQSSSVRCVVFLSCLDRDVPFMNFRPRMLMFNRTLASLCYESDCCLFYRVRGFACDSQGLPLLVRAWASDGAHPDRNSCYFVKFLYELRAALLGALAPLGLMLFSDTLTSPPYRKDSDDREPPPSPPPSPAIPVY